MTYFGWIHIIRSKEHADIFWKSIFDSGGYISLFHYGVLNGALLTKNGRLFGVEAEESLVLMTNSVGSVIIDEFIDRNVTSHEETVCLDDLYDDDFVETDDEGLLLWSIKYISHEEFYRKLRERKKKLII